jgi:hypothetical protein
MIVIIDYYIQIAGISSDGHFVSFGDDPFCIAKNSGKKRVVVKAPA